MRDKANVRSLQSLQDARAAMADFRDVVRVALGEAMADVQRTQFWITNDCHLRWRSEQKRRSEKLQQAKSEYARAQMSEFASATSVREEKAAVKKWTMAVDEAEQKLRSLKKWSTMLDREITLFKGQLQTLGRAVDGDLPRADAKLLRMIDALEKYIRLPVAGRPHTPSAPVQPEPEKKDSPS